MSETRHIAVDGNEAAASIAYRASEIIAIYPITPASPMGELADEWAAAARPNLWGDVPKVVEMQSEAGAAGAVHGALQAGALATTFTSSQGLLLMIPNMYKIAGELNAFCMHVAARAVATHALSIFGDHSDVMACRGTGFAFLASGSVQEAHDLAAVAHAATLRSRVPFLHFFDGFRTSHEIARIGTLPDDALRALLDEEAIQAHRRRALTPDRPVLRGTAQNPDVFFQAREACNPFYLAIPDIVQDTMDRLASLTGRAYRLFEYAGHPEAERVMVMMGSGAETAHETVDWLVRRGERVGVVKVRLYRPFSLRAFAASLPPSVRAVAVLDRTKEPGAPGEPLYLDVVAALQETRAAGLRGAAQDPMVGGGRYGLASKEFTPAMVKAVLDDLARERPRNHFTVGIEDDVTRTSLALDPDFDIEPDDVRRMVFYGLGSDGTVGANKNSIKIIAEETPLFGQAYFEYDSKKSGAVTVSHLRFGPRPIRSAHLIRRAHFVACHHPVLLERRDVLERAAEGAVLLLNSPHPPERIWDALPRGAQESILARKVQIYAVDAAAVARDAGLGGRINSVMQACFFALAGVLPQAEAIAHIKAAIRRTYGRKGEDIVRRNEAAVDRALEGLRPVPVPGRVTATGDSGPAVPAEAPPFVRRVTAPMLIGQGDRLPVSAFPVDGTWPLSTSRWEKRRLAQEIPVWDPALCIQCNKCVLICPHATIRAKVAPAESLEGAPPGFLSAAHRGPEKRSWRYTLQVAPEDCTGCALCVEYCPVHDRSNPRHKAIDLRPVDGLEADRARWSFFQGLPEADRTAVRLDVKGTQLLQPLFEYSGACAGCGETPYIKLLTQLFGDRILIANATGCSSIFGGNLPTTPYATGPDGRGPAWSNSLFEDNAEFGLGMRLALDHQAAQARALLGRLSPQVGAELAAELLGAEQADERGLADQRGRVASLRAVLARLDSPEARSLEQLADALVRKSVWIVGGDGWAYDIGYGGLDHVLASGADVKVLVLDTEVYSNTGGQQSKATPLGAAAKFAVAGKATPKKDLGLLAMTYGHVYVARVALGAKDAQTVKAFLEAASFPGPALILAYSPCIAHGYDLAHGAAQQKLAVESGHWPLFRFDPRRKETGSSPLQIDSSPPRAEFARFASNELRYRTIKMRDPERFRRLMEEARRAAAERFALYERLAALTAPAVQAGPGRAASSSEAPKEAPEAGAVPSGRRS